MAVARRDRGWVLVKNPSLPEAASNDKVVASPAMIAAAAVRIQRAAELRRGEENHLLPIALLLHLRHEAAEGVVHLLELGRQALLHVAVHVPPAHRDEKDVALGVAPLVGVDELGNLPELT